MGFFERLFSLFGSSDADAEKARLLKRINKELNKTKVKFYKYNSGEALAQLAKFFFGLYKIVGPTQFVFKNTINPNTFKNLVINHYLTDAQKNLAEKLDESTILEQAKTIPIKELAGQVKADLSAYLNAFDTEKITKIDTVYTKLSLFIGFCMFDYYFLLKKFDSGMQEQNFSYTPRFDNIRAEYILEDLKDFTSVAWSLPLNEDWTEVFTVLKEMPNIKPLSTGTWNKTMQLLRRYRDKAVFEMIIQLIAKDPGYQTVITEHKEHIIDDQLNKMRHTVENALQKIQTEQKNSKIDEIVRSIFGDSAGARLKNYTEENTKTFEKKGLSGYTYCAPLNYLKAFLIEYMKKYIREFADLVLVRGQWVSSTLSAPMSEAYHELLGISEKITEFDNMLAEDGETGAKIKTYLLRAERDKEAKNILNSIIRDANEKAYAMLTSATKDFIVLGKNTKNLLEDIDRKKPEILMNWQELIHFADQPIKEQGIALYKQIYLFVNLMKYFLGTGES